MKCSMYLVCSTNRSDLTGTGMSTYSNKTFRADFNILTTFVTSARITVFLMTVTRSCTLAQRHFPPENPRWRPGRMDVTSGGWEQPLMEEMDQTLHQNGIGNYSGGLETNSA